MTLFFDTETTHFTVSSKLVEFALIDNDENVILNTLCNPKIIIPKLATDNHGITDKMVCDAPLSKDVINQALDIMRGEDIVVYNTAYNLYHFREIYDIVKSVSCCNWEYAEAYGGYDTLFGNSRRQNLIDAARQTGYKDTEFHRALDSAKACRHVWNFLKSNKYQKGSINGKAI